MSLSTNFPTVGPVLNLDFVNNQTLDPRITFTRASTATYYDYAGILRTAQNNIPRFDYNPSTLVPQGLLIEESRTNLLTYSEQFNNAAWTAVTTTVSANATTAPDGTLTAEQLTAAGTLPRMVQNPTLANSTDYVGSIYLKQGTAYVAGLQFTNKDNVTVSAFFNLSLGTVVSGAGTITDVGNGWYRCSLPFNSGSGATAIDLRFVRSAPTDTGGWTGTNTIFAWGAQLEAGAFATSYIPTVAATVTRQADVASMTGTNFSSWFNASEGTIYSEAELINGAAVVAAGSTNFTVTWISDGGGTNFITQRYNAAASPPLQFAGLANSATQWALTSAGLPLGAYSKNASAYKFNDIAQSVNAGTVGTDTSAILPVVNRLDIGVGNSATQSLNGHVRKVSYYNFRMTNAQLQALTRS